MVLPLMSVEVKSGPVLQQLRTERTQQHHLQPLQLLQAVFFQRFVTMLSMLGATSQLNLHTYPLETTRLEGTPSVLIFT